MTSCLTWQALPDDISLWTGLPLSLSGEEVMPLDYQAGHNGWLLYGSALDKHALQAFQHRYDQPLVIVSGWRIEGYQVVRLAGRLTLRARQLANAQGLDTAPAGPLPRLQSPGLLLMDMDSTAIQIECIDEMARLMQCGDQVAAITERAMRGELDFTHSLRQRVATLAGMDAALLDQLLATLPLTPGLSELVKKLQALGWQVAIASGGFSWFAQALRERLGLAAAVANELEVVDGKLTGRVIGPIVDAAYKAQILHALAQQYGIAPAQTVAIGDGANDIPMLQAAGLGIAWRAKPIVNRQARAAIMHADLTGVLCILSSTLQHKPN